MTEEKKATDIIQDTNTKVTEILGYIKNLDYKYSLILERLNKLTTKSETAVVSSIPVAAPLSKITIEAPEITFPEYKPPPASPKTSDLKSKLQLALEQAQQDQEEEDKLSVVTQQDGKKRTLRQHAENQTRQIPVQQRISFSDGKPVYMATVEIYDPKHDLLKQTKTNQVGKWLSSLAPGDYHIRVTKSAGPLKAKVELEYQVTIPNQDATVDLGTKTVAS